MPKEYFDFKKFRIYQDKCAMKVCTDSCLFGAWIDVETSKNILDIGTGTGLLSLMAAQRTKAKIVAIEIDENAYNQANSNFINSIFSNQIAARNISIQEFQKEYLEKFDTIICNPPFYKNHLKSYEESKNKAKHNSQLSFEELVAALKILLTTEGKFHLILPEYESKLFDSLMIDFQKVRECEVYNKIDDKNVFRVFTTYVFKDGENRLEKEKIFIKNEVNLYSYEFEKYLKIYYTIF